MGETPRTFTITADGRSYPGVEFPSGRVAVDRANGLDAATSVEDFTARWDGQIEWNEDRHARLMAAVVQAAGHHRDLAEILRVTSELLTRMAQALDYGCCVAVHCSESHAATAPASRVTDERGVEVDPDRADGSEGAEATTGARED